MLLKKVRSLRDGIDVLMYHPRGSGNRGSGERNERGSDRSEQANRTNTSRQTAGEGSNNGSCLEVEFQPFITRRLSVNYVIKVAG